MTLTCSDVATLACPACRGALRYRGGDQSPTTDATQAVAAPFPDGTLVCPSGHEWPVHRGIPRLCDESSVDGVDRALRPIYNFIAPYHDLGVDFVLPLVQFPDIGASRERYVRELQLGALRPHADGSPVRILEIGVGSGANVPLIAAALPANLDAELWGIDLSSGMLAQAVRNLESMRDRRVRLVLGDAHTLPFADATFDRVFHVGGINGYRDIRRALAEMARVARADTPIVVVDEELDPDRWHSLLHRLAFASITFFDVSPHAPSELVPGGAHHVAVTHVSRFYYCLTFRAHKPKEHTMAISDILTHSELARLRQQYDALLMGTLMGSVFTTTYPASTPYIDTIGALFYGGPTANLTDAVLNAPNRERCLIALLATRGAGLNLALHIYMALAANVSPEEIAQILLLVGTYSGVDNFAGAIQAEQKTLETLRTVLQAGSATPKEVFAALVKAFAPA
jgi:ubiquinone/menaquinone biosynthesis C-methylase UbiE/alkylhydroperoxidase/carboxymuconolactone decarboxylase family protein YurZ/uncharacterized protein YbaR (Trm112 family)